MKHRGYEFLRSALLVILGVGLASCGGKSGLPDLKVETFNFSPTLSGVRINAPLELTMSAPVDPASVNADSVRIFTTTTTQDQPDPGAPAIGEFVVSGNIIRFLPRIPQRADLTDAGLRIGFRYAVQVPAAPDIIAPVNSIEGDPMVVPFSEEFTTLNQTILPAPGDINAEPNLPRLHQYFIDEGIQNGTDPCPRADLPAEDRDAPQVIFTDPSEGESGFGRITGIQAGLGTAFVRLDPITLIFSEPVGPWRVRAEDITIRNTNLGGETFDLFLFFQQDRTQTRLQITVFDADSAFDQASVPQGRYLLSLTNFCDLSGNLLVNSSTCEADGTFQLSFSTVSSPTLPTDVKLTFDDDDGDGHVDVGGLPTGTNNPNEFRNFLPPFLGGEATDIVAVPSTSGQTSSANWGDIGYFTGNEVLWDNGFSATAPGMDRPVPPALRLRGGSVGAATAILAPIAGRGTGASDPTNGSTEGSIPVDPNAPGEDPLDSGKVDFKVIGVNPAAGGLPIIRLNTGNAATGPIVYNYRSFTLKGDTSGRPVLTATTASIFPLMIFVEDDIEIVDAVVSLDGQNGDFGFNGLNDGSGSSLLRNPGGAGGLGIAGGGSGGNGGAFELGGVALLNGANGGVPVNVFGTLDQLTEGAAGVANMANGGGGFYDPNGSPDPNTGDEPVYQGGGGGGNGSDGTNGADAGGDITLPDGHGVGGKQYGTGSDFKDPDTLACGGAGGGGGGAEDDGGGAGGGDPNGQSDVNDDGGGGGGGGGGFLGLYAGGDITLGEVGDIMDHTTFLFASLRCVGGRGGSTYNAVVDNPPIPGSVSGTPDFSTPIGEGEAGGGGAGGGICIIAGNQIVLNAVEMYAHGKVGGNSPFFEGGGRGSLNMAGNGGGGVYYIADSDGLTTDEIPAQAPFFGLNEGFLIIPDPNRDIDNDDVPDLDPNDPDDALVIRDLQEMSGQFGVTASAWGDDARERLFTTSQIVTEFFDTLSDSTSYDGVRVLSNAPRFSYDADPVNAPVPQDRTIRVFVDTTRSSNGFPDLGNEDPATGNLGAPSGASEEIGLNFDRITGDELPTPQYESRYIIPVNTSLLQFRRFVRVRIVFDLSTVGNKNELLSSFAPPGAPNLPIADDPNTPDPENTLGNTDTAPQGVPAVAELRVTFTVGG